MATWVVAKNGNNSNPGTESSPRLTILGALPLVHPGDTLLIRNGTYAERFDKVIPAGLSWSSPVTIASYPGETAILRPDLYFYIVNLEGEAKYIIFDRLVMDGVNVSGNCMKISRNSTTAPSAHHIRLQNCKLKNAPHVCLLIQSKCDYCEVLKCDLSNSGKTIDSDGLYSYGIYLKSSYCLVDGCNIFDNGSSGMQIFSTSQATEPSNYNVVRNSKFYANTTHSAALNRGTGVSVAGGTGNALYNVVAYNQRSGITVSYCSGTKIYHATVTDNAVYGFDLRESVYSLQVKNSISYGNGTDLFQMGSYISPTGGGNLFGVNPLFVAP